MQKDVESISTSFFAYRVKQYRIQNAN